MNLGFIFVFIFCGSSEAGISSTQNISASSNTNVSTTQTMSSTPLSTNSNTSISTTQTVSTLLPTTSKTSGSINQSINTHISPNSHNTGVSTSQTMSTLTLTSSHTSISTTQAMSKPLTTNSNIGVPTTQAKSRPLSTTSSTTSFTNASLATINFTSTEFTTQPITTTVPLPLIIDVKLIFSKRIFHQDLYNHQSLTFLRTKNEVEKEIKNAYNETENFISVTIIGFDEGSIICESRLFFSNSSEQEVCSLKEILINYGNKSGEFQVSKFKKAADNGKDDDDDDDIILGLDWWQIGLVIAGVVIFILLIAVIVLCRKISIKKRAQGNMSPYSGPFYETIGREEEMKTLRASPKKAEVGITSTSRNGNTESGKQKVNMYSSASSNVKSDGLVNETTSKVGMDNAGVEVNEYDYVTVLDSNSGTGDVLKL